MLAYFKNNPAKCSYITLTYIISENDWNVAIYSIPEANYGCVNNIKEIDSGHCGTSRHFFVGEGEGGGQLDLICWDSQKQWWACLALNASQVALLCEQLKFVSGKRQVMFHCKTSCNPFDEFIYMYFQVWICDVTPLMAKNKTVALGLAMGKIVFGLFAVEDVVVCFIFVHSS